MWGTKVITPMQHAGGLHLANRPALQANCALRICTLNDIGVLRNLIGFGFSGYSASLFFKIFLIFGLAHIGYFLYNKLVLTRLGGRLRSPMK